ncbi:uncharacterized protein LOC128932145 [Callithrix jacchus]|uniref:proline-rich protein HaeIII subfamily 1-like n=1 Tax=Callithrix jacchus TaxID=9483 RepID=UPI0023DD2760|nr:proline-rich protein HaeIII subfamily 1-like [Callithrix jacchus]
MDEVWGGEDQSRTRGPPHPTVRDRASTQWPSSPRYPAAQRPPFSGPRGGDSDRPPPFPFRAGGKGVCECVCACVCWGAPGFTPRPALSPAPREAASFHLSSPAPPGRAGGRKNKGGLRPGRRAEPGGRGGAPARPPASPGPGPPVPPVPPRGGPQYLEQERGPVGLHGCGGRPPSSPLPPLGEPPQPEEATTKRRRRRRQRQRRLLNMAAPSAATSEQKSNFWLDSVRRCH